MADETHAESLERVSLRIAAAVMQFCRECLRRENRLFHADELRNFLDWNGRQPAASQERFRTKARKLWERYRRTASAPRASAAAAPLFPPESSPQIEIRA